MRHLLVRATNWLGDAVISIPALREIRQLHTGWHITILARPWVASLYEREDFCDTMMLYAHDGRHSGLIGKERLVRELRKRRFDRAILLQNAFDAAWLAWRAGIRQRIGYKRDGRSALLSHRIDKPKKGEIPEHQRFYYLELLKRAHFFSKLPECNEIRLAGVNELRLRGIENWKHLGLPDGPWIGISPGAAFGTAKRWLPDRFATVAHRLAVETGAKIAVFGSVQEAALAAEVAALAGSNAHCLAGKTKLSEFIELAATCSLYLTNDSGPMHVVSALGVPTVAIFGATDAKATGPSAPWARIIEEEVECSPCLLRECPLEEHLCMLHVSSERVIDEALALLAESGSFKDQDGV